MGLGTPDAVLKARCTVTIYIISPGKFKDKFYPPDALYRFDESCNADAIPKHPVSKRSIKNRSTFPFINGN